MSDQTYKTEQEAFWAGDFGEGYMDRNVGDRLTAQKISMFSRALRGAGDVTSCCEFGCNIGLNLKALSLLNNGLRLKGIEINETAAEKARALNVADITVGSIIESLKIKETFDITFTIGVLIHINPEYLPIVYDNLVQQSNRYVLVSEYYSRMPEALPYRGHDNKLFKRDFAGELIDRHNLDLVDYGFCYHRDKQTPLGDLSWFLMRKP